MTITRLRIGLVVASVLVGGRCVPAASEPAAPPRAEPVEFTAMRDSQGFLWDVGENGMVGDGSDDCFDGGLLLMVNGRQFSARRRARLPGNNGYLLEGSSGELKVARRVELDAKRAVLWYLESFTNPGRQPVEVSAALHTELGDHAKVLLGSDGANFNGGLARGQSGLLALTSGGRPSVLFLLGGPRRGVRPTVAASNRRTFRFTYCLTVAPGQTASVLHAVGQRRGMDAEAHLPAFKALCRGETAVRPPFSAELQASVVNFALVPDGESAPGGPHIEEVLRLAEERGIDRGKAAVLVMKGGAQLSGKAAGGPLRIETAWGAQEVPLDDVAMLVGRGGRGRLPRVLLRSGEVITGAVRAADLALETASGLRMTIDPDQAEALFTGARPEDGIAPEGTAVFVRTQRGDRLAVSRLRPEELEALSPWGRLRLKSDAISGLAPGDGALSGLRLTLAGGSNLPVLVVTDELELASQRLGTVKLAGWDLAGLARVEPRAAPSPAGAPAPAAGAPAPATGAAVKAEQAGTPAGGDGGPPVCRLIGENQVSGEPVLAAFQVATGSGQSEVGCGQVLGMTRLHQGDGDRLGRPVFSLQLEGKQSLCGALGPELLPLRTEGGLLRVPVEHLVGFARQGNGKSPGSPGRPSAAAAQGATSRPVVTAVWRQHRAKLVAAAFGHKTDSQGFRWDIGGDGSVEDGTNDCFDGGLKLRIGGAQFSPTEQQMTSDGSEYVFRCNARGLQIERWVRFDSNACAVRYVEVFRNLGTAATDVSATILSCLGSNCQSVWTDKGRPAANLESGECGLIAYNGSRERPTVLFLVAGPSSRLKPQVSVRDNHTFMFTYNFAVPPGRSVAILHVVAQRRAEDSIDGKRLNAMFAPMTRVRWLQGVPDDVRGAVANARGLEHWMDGEPGAVLALETLGVAPEQRDVLVFGGETRLAGKAECAELAVENDLGSLRIPFADAIALVGASHSAGRTCVILRDGRVLAGKVTARGLRFESEAGPALDLSVERIDRLVLRSGPPAKAPRIAALLDTSDGQRLALTDRPGPALAVVTPWGPMEVPFAKLRSLSALAGTPGFCLRLADGSRLCALFRDETLEVETVSFGKLKLNPWRVRAIVPPKPEADDSGAEEESDIEQPYLVLDNGSVLVGEVREAKLHLETPAGALVLRPRQVRSLERVAERPGPGGQACFSAVLWNGDIAQGFLSESVLAVESSGRVLRVPVREVVRFAVPLPEVSEEVCGRARALIAELGSNDWKKREAATEGLVKIGLAAKALVRRAMAEAKDPEVRRRLAEVLEEIKGTKEPFSPVYGVDEDGVLRRL